MEMLTYKLQCIFNLMKLETSVCINKAKLFALAYFDIKILIKTCIKRFMFIHETNLNIKKLESFQKLNFHSQI